MKAEEKKKPEEKKAEHNTRTDTSNNTIATISGAVAPRRRLKPKAKQQISKTNASSSSEDDFVVDVDYLPMGKAGQTRTDIFQTKKVPVNEFKQKRYEYSEGLEIPMTSTLVVLKSLINHARIQKVLSGESKFENVYFF